MASACFAISNQIVKTHDNSNWANLILLWPKIFQLLDEAFRTIFLVIMSVFIDYKCLHTVLGFLVFLNDFVFLILLIAVIRLTDYFYLVGWALEQFCGLARDMRAAGVLFERMLECRELRGKRRTVVEVRLCLLQNGQGCCCVTLFN